MNPLVREYLNETEDLIEVLLGDIQLLRLRRDEGSARRDLVARVFRHVHTIKGSAAALEFNVAAQIAHEVEALLEGARMGWLPIDAVLLDVLEDGASAIAEALRSSAHGGSVLPVALIQRIQNITTSKPLAQAIARADGTISLLPAEISRSLSQYERSRLREALAEGGSLFTIGISFAIETFDERYRQLSAALSAGGDLISTMPGTESIPDDHIGFRLVYATTSDAALLIDLVAPFGAAAVVEHKLDQDVSTRSSLEELIAPEPLEAAAQTAPLDLGHYSENASSRFSLLRVDLTELDELISAARELFREMDLTLTLALSSVSNSVDRSELEHYASRIRRRSRVLEERVVGLRMVALEQTLTRAVRAGASAARMVGKEIDILQSGGQVQIDKTLADTIFEPLLHLMRNAVDHGIESEPDRVRAGKNARGLVRLSASSTGERVVLTLSDDGRGIDSDLILTTARARGLVRADEPLTKQQCLRLIFKPGFSTASEVSNISGRGVGLDVVETRVAQVGGDLRIVTTPGVGTMFEMVLPATLAMVSALIVRSGPYCYCIPAGHVAGIGYVNAYDVMQGDDYATVEWHDETMPFVNLCDVLAEPERNAPAGDQIQIVVVPIAASGTDGGADVGSSHMAAVAVDCWEGRQDVLVRNLGARASHWLGVQGATELVDGRVALLLDLPSLLSANLDSVA